MGVEERQAEESSKSLWPVLLFVGAGVLFMIGIGLIWARETAVNPAVTPTPQSAAVVQVSPQPSVEPTQTALPPTETAVPPTATLIPTVTVTPMPLPKLSNPQDDRLAALAEQWFADFARLDAENTGIWQYQSGNFIHPIALEIADETAYLIDGGRVLVLDLAAPAPPQLLLKEDDEVEGVRVLEPVDLALMQDHLLVLDRAGDVYRYEFADASWHLDRYDRPSEASSGHYFVALDAPDNLDPDNPTAYVRSLLETNYKFVSQYGQESTPLWNLPEARAVDVSSYGDQVYVLLRELHAPQGQLYLYQDTSHIKTFNPRAPIENPLQIVATETAVYVLDQNGLRLLALEPRSGELLEIYQLPQDAPVSVFWAAVDGSQFVFAARDRLYFLDQPQRLAAVPGGDLLDLPQPHDLEFLATLTNFRVPIGGSNITFRDFQMPGAPRHYRLGVHHGLDFYWQPGTDVVAAGDGVVMWADVDYVPPTAFDLGAWYNDTQARGYTTDEILNLYLGRQVWIEHENGVITRYAHLSALAPGIAPGIAVTRGQKIGEVGNSGSPASLVSAAEDAHLHFEMWLGEDNYLGQYLRPIETRWWVEQMLPP